MTFGSNELVIFKIQMVNQLVPKITEGKVGYL